MADNPTHQTSNNHGRNVDTGGHLEAKGDGGQKRLHHKRNEQVLDDAEDLLLLRAEVRVENSSVIARCREFKQELRDGQLRVSVPVAEDPRHHRHQCHL